MRIAFNAGAFLKYQLDRNIYFTWESFLQSVAPYPQDQFLFIFQKPFNPELKFPANVTPVVVGPEGDSTLKWRFRYAFRIPSALKKFKAEVFISPTLVSVRAKIPQLLVWPETGFIEQPGTFEKRELTFLNRNTPRFLSQAAGIMVPSLASKKMLQDHYKVHENKISVLYPNPETNFNALPIEKKEAIRQKLSQGNEFFIYTGFIGTHQNLTNLLKAFSFFKKRQKSSMHLIIAGKQGTGYEEFIRSLQLYRFNKEVNVLTDLPRKEMEEITGSAYAMCYFPLSSPSSSIVISAMQCEVPIITSDRPALREYGGDAGIYADPTNYKEISEQMMLLYRDEQLRNNLIQKGVLQASVYQEKSLPFFSDLLQLAKKTRPLQVEDGR